MSEQEKKKKFFHKNETENEKMYQNMGRELGAKQHTG